MSRSTEMLMEGHPTYRVWPGYESHRAPPPWQEMEPGFWLVVPEQGAVRRVEWEARYAGPQIGETLVLSGERFGVADVIWYGDADTCPIGLDVVLVPVGPRIVIGGPLGRGRGSS